LGNMVKAVVAVEIVYGSSRLIVADYGRLSQSEVVESEL
jgi:hypothetical protein